MTSCDVPYISISHTQKSNPSQSFHYIHVYDQCCPMYELLEYVIKLIIYPLKSISLIIKSMERSNVIPIIIHQEKHRSIVYIIIAIYGPNTVRSVWTCKLHICKLWFLFWCHIVQVDHMRICVKRQTYIVVRSTAHLRESCINDFSKK